VEYCEYVSDKADLKPDISRAQIKELIEPQINSEGNEIRVFSPGGLRDLQLSADLCGNIFKELEVELMKASKQIQAKKPVVGKIALTATERAKWPFHQPKIDEIRAELRESKGNLLLMLSITSLANAKRLALEYDIPPLCLL
jgi:hypothetical protein